MIHWRGSALSKVTSRYLVVLCIGSFERCKGNSKRGGGGGEGGAQSREEKSYLLHGLCGVLCTNGPTVQGRAPHWAGPGKKGRGGGWRHLPFFYRKIKFESSARGNRRHAFGKERI
jgi:hypothetical protein